MVGNLREKKKKNGLFKKTKWKVKKKIWKKYGLEQKQKEKKIWRKKRSSSAIWALLCKVSGIGIIWKKIVLH